MNGPETVKSLRATLGFTGVILGEAVECSTLLDVTLSVGITGNALPEDLRTFKESGVDEVLIKPLSKAKLLAAFHEHIRTGDNAV